MSLPMPAGGGKSSLVTRDALSAAASVVAASPHVVRTPLVAGYPLVPGVDVRLKMESVQLTGSFKIRGMVNAFHRTPKEQRAKGLVTMSAGNAGKSFATLAAAEGLDAVVVMPDSVPAERRAALEALGAKVELAPLSELQKVVNGHVTRGRRFVHPYDDVDLIAGHATVGAEILEDYPDVDVVLVCCGGGGLVAGVAAAVKLGVGRRGGGNDGEGGGPSAGSGGGAEAVAAPPQREGPVRVFAVEPTGAPTMRLSVEAGSPQPFDPVRHKTVAHGLAAPYAGPTAFAHVQKWVDGVLLVSDDELAAAARTLYGHGWVVEASGAAGLAALLGGRVPGVGPGSRVAVVVTGSNISVDELGHEMFGQGAWH